VIPSDLLLAAYSSGWFPMADEAGMISWYSPDPRGVLPLQTFHVPSRLQRTMRRSALQVRVDTMFADVMRACAEAEREGEDGGTWISDEIIASYSALHTQGYAHSVEVHDGGRLVGGLYGVALGGAFFGESMFSRARDASKFALIALVARLHAGGFRLLDTQFVTAHLARLGAVEIGRAAYHRRLAAAVDRRADFFALPDDTPRQRLLQLSTQTS
jgi:leucyl/phenylalanyl-tRNA--protein transferase